MEKDRTFCGEGTILITSFEKSKFSARPCFRSPPFNLWPSEIKMTYLKSINELCKTDSANTTRVGFSEIVEYFKDVRIVCFSAFSSSYILSFWTFILKCKIWKSRNYKKKRANNQLQNSSHLMCEQLIQKLVWKPEAWRPNHRRATLNNYFYITRVWMYKRDSVHNEICWGVSVNTVQIWR